MALDHALAAALRDDEAVLRLYAWKRPTISFGRNEPAREVYGRAVGSGREVAAGKTRGQTVQKPDGPAAGRTRGPDVPEPGTLDWVRRPTGGRAVLHHAEVTYAVVAPARALGGPREAYRRINEALAAALASLGAPVALSGATSVPTLDAGPCFQSPAEGEVTVEGRKLVGSAQARIGGVLLQHGSILLGDDQSRLEALRTEAAVGDRAAAFGDSSSADGGASGRGYTAPATLSSVLPGTQWADVADAVAAHMQKTFDGGWRTDEYRRDELDAAARLEAERYGTEAWTWRR